MTAGITFDAGALIALDAVDIADHYVVIADPDDLRCLDSHLDVVVV